MVSLVQFFQDYLQKNIVVAIVILVVMLARIMLKKFPKKYAYILWSFVGIRMVFDISVTSGISLFTFVRSVGDWGKKLWDTGKAENTLPQAVRPVQIPAGNVMNAGGAADIGQAGVLGEMAVQVGETTINAGMAGKITDTPSMQHMIELVLTGLAMVWVMGIILILIYGIWSYVKCRQTVRLAVRLRSNIWECDKISSPFVLGILSPQIYIPFHLREEEQKYILAHEYIHIRRRDYLIKLFAFGLLAIYWINPLTWAAFHLMSKDMEMSCDETVLEKFGLNIKKSYSTSLLNCAKEAKHYSFAPIAFGESDAGKRIKNVLRFQKPKVWVSACLLMGTAVLAVVCLTDADSEKESTAATGEDKPAAEQVIQSESVGGSEAETEEDRWVHGDALIDIEYSSDRRERQIMYQQAISRLANEDIFPNGQPAEPDEYSGTKAENYYKIMDVDGDKRQELIIHYLNASSMAAMSYYIFEYDLDHDQFHQELAVWPAVTIYDNGIIIAKASHNHGRSDLADFWPYNVYKYDRASDTYELFAQVDAWDTVLFGSGEADENFPHEKDEDGDGVVYYLMKEGSFDPEIIMDKAEYEGWLSELTADARQIDIEYDVFRADERHSEIVWESNDLDLDGNGVPDYASVEIETFGQEHKNIVTVLLDNAVKKVMEYAAVTEGRQDFISVDTGRLHYPDRDSLVIELGNSTSNYGAADIHVLSLVGDGESAELTEDLTLLSMMTMSPLYEQYQDTVLLLDTTVTQSCLIKYVESLGTYGIQIDEYRSNKTTYVYWDNEQWNFMETFTDRQNDAIEEAAKGSLLSQLHLIAENKELWMEDPDYADDIYQCTVTDLDRNGRYEIIVSNMGGTGIYTYSRFFQVNDSYDGLEECETDFVEGMSQPDLIVDEWKIYMDDSTGQFYYIVNDYLKNGAAEHYENVQVLSLKDNKISLHMLARRTTIYRQNGAEITCKDADGNVISEEAYKAVVQNHFASGYSEDVQPLKWLHIREQPESTVDLTYMLGDAVHNY